MTTIQSSQNQASKALAEMCNINQDYICRLFEIQALYKVIHKMIDDDPLPIFKENAPITYTGAYLAIGFTDQFSEKIEYWDNRTRQLEADTDTKEIVIGIYHDYKHYLSIEIQHLININQSMIDEISKANADDTRHFDLNVLQWVNLAIKRLSVQLQSDLGAEIEALTELYPDLFGLEV